MRWTSNQVLNDRSHYNQIGVDRLNAVKIPLSDFHMSYEADKHITACVQLGQCRPGQ